MTGFPKAVREQIVERAGGACERCGMTAQASQHHHRRARGMGGSKAADTNTAANGLLLCIPCHADVESNREEALRFGWLVRQGQNPMEVSVLRKGAWVRLADNGWMH